MIRLLHNLVLLKEVDEVAGVKYSSAQLKKLYPKKIIVMRHTSYIYRDVLCDVAKENVTPLDDYIQLGELVDYISISKILILARINFMKKTGTKLFDYMMVGNVIFIKIDEEFKYLLQNFQPFLANFKDVDTLIHCKLLGDMKIGFY